MLFGPKKIAILHDPQQDRDPIAWVAVGGEEIIEELSHRLHLGNRINDDEAH